MLSNCSRLYAFYMVSSNISYLVKAQGPGFLALSVVLCNWDLNNRRMLHFSADPYHRLVLELFSTASCSVRLLLGEE